MDPVLSSTIDDPNEVIEDGDEVIREIPVYLTNSLASSMHLIQFPLVPSGNVKPYVDTTDNHNCNSKASISSHNPMERGMIPESARVKPKHKLLEVEYLHPHSQFAHSHSVDANDRDTLKYTSKYIPNKTNLTIARWGKDGGSLHLTPLYRTIQMRPTLEHVDAMDPANFQQDLDDDDAMDIDEEQQNTTKPLLFQKKESERVLAARRNSYAFKKASEASEEWTDLTVVKSSFRNVHCNNKKLMEQTLCLGTHIEIPCKSRDDYTYVKTLNYLSSEGRGQQVVSSNYNNISGNGDNKLEIGDDDDDDDQNNNSDLLEEVTNIFLNGKPIPFPVIQERFNKVDEGILLDACMSASVMVRGNLIVKSSLLVNLDPLVQDARDALLIMLNKHGIIKNRRQVTELYGLSDDDEALIICIIEKFAVKRNQYWAPKIEDDGFISAKFPSKAVLYDQYWKRREEELGQKLADIIDAIPNLDQAG